MTQVKGLCVMDVDGTLIAEEVIDLLGKEAGCEEEISELPIKQCGENWILKRAYEKESLC